jgi:hypothetical protein
MKITAILLNTLAFAALFFDYAVAMDPPQPAGTRRLLQTIAGQNPTGSFPTRKPIWELGVRWSDGI